MSEHAAPRDGSPERDVSSDRNADDAEADRSRSGAGGARFTRRTLLSTAGTAGAVGLAGCTARQYRAPPDC
ncbi:cell shape-determining protein, partial [Natrinema soli]